MSPLFLKTPRASAVASAEAGFLYLVRFAPSEAAGLAGLWRSARGCGGEVETWLRGGREYSCEIDWRSGGEYLRVDVLFDSVLKVNRKIKKGG